MGTALAVAALLTIATPVRTSAAAPQQTAQPAAPSAPAQSPAPLPVDTSRIREALAQPSTVRLDTGRRFHVEVIGQRPLFTGLGPGVDLRYGPVPRSGMTHQDYLGLVTPRELSQPTGAAAVETLMGGLVGAGAFNLINTLLGKLEKAHSAWEVRRIREQIDRELAALEKRRGGG
jgi:hypothetical protein